MCLWVCFCACMRGCMHVFGRVCGCCCCWSNRCFDHMWLMFCLCRCVRKLIPVTDMLMFESDYGVMHPLVQALKLPTTDILQQLLAAGLSPSGVRTLEQDQVDELQELSDGFVETGCKASLLCHVPSDAPLEATQFLLERGMSPNADQLNGVSELSPLVAAMMRGNLPLFCLLLKHGAKPNVYSARGNVSMVYALHRDLQHRGNVADGTAKANTKTLDSSLSENGAASCLWLNQAKHSFFLRLWAAGGEVQSLLQDPSTGEAGRWQLASVIQTNLCEGSQQDSSRLQRSRAQVMALLALLLCLSRNVVSLPDSLLQLVSPDQAKQLASLAGNNNDFISIALFHVKHAQLRWTMPMNNNNNNNTHANAHTYTHTHTHTHTHTRTHTHTHTHTHMHHKLT